MNKFKKDPNYLLKYCINCLLLFIVLDVTLYWTKGVDFNLQLTELDYFLPLLGIIFCGLPSSLMHNCAHSNIRPRWLNQAVGEICGTVMLYGFKGFALAHMFHHIYPDDPHMDPHPPHGQSFLRFVVSPIKATLRVVESAYYKNFGISGKTKNNILLQLVLFNLGLIARTMFWLLFLGPKFFVLGYLPVYMANIFVFAHINYAAHVEKADGSVIIINLNGNMYYKMANFLSMGGYFHKSHHLRPTAFNPQKIKINDLVDYVSYVPVAHMENDLHKVASA